MHHQRLLLFCICALVPGIAEAREERYYTPSPSSYPSDYYGYYSDEKYEAAKFTPEPTYEPTLPPSPRPTPRPSPRPTISPTPFPTRSPSKSPTSIPTNQPTVSTAPSVAPTTRPTLLPSAPPSSEPSVTAMPSDNPSSTPSAVPSSAPSSSPSKSARPSAAPSSVPSIQPTGLVTVELPRLQLDFNKQSNSTVAETATLDEKVLKQELDLFIAGMLFDRDDKHKLVSLDTELAIQDNNRAVVVTGEANFIGRDDVTGEDLKEAMIAYFAYWGINDLKLRLKNVGVPLAYVDVNIDGVQFNDKEIEDETKPQESDDNFFSTTILVGIFVLAGIPSIALAAFVIYRSRMKRLSGGAKEVRSDSSEDENENEVVEAAPKPVAWESQSEFSAQYSFDESLFTTDVDAYSALHGTGTPPTFNSDPSLLDQIISTDNRGLETDDED